MNYAEFRASRRAVEDVTVADRFSGPPEPNDPRDAGFIYATGLYISLTEGPHWPEDIKAQGAYHLIDGNCEWIDNDLERLERLLWESYECELVDEPAP